MQVTPYHLRAMMARTYLNRAAGDLNKTTTRLLADVGIRRARPNLATGVLVDLMTAERSAVTSAIASASDRITRNQTADTALGTIYTKLGEMRDLVEEVATVDHTAEEIVQQYPSVELADVYQVIGYYLRHRSDVEGYLAERRACAESVRQENEARFDPQGVRDRLLSRRMSGGP